MSAHNSRLDLSDDELMPPPPKHDDAMFDVTAMIDVVSLMNIYFLVTFVGAAMGEGNLPAADHCAPLDPESSTIITIVSTGFQKVDIYLGDGKKGTPVSDPEEQEEQIADLVSTSLKSGKNHVLLKADKDVRLRDMRRLALAASREGGVLHFSVMERDRK
ncbi:MAG TPA: biopolymer transporter ExbD [Pirellulaceae bacterium]|jgi:biopolymer transport protein ExbD|nr:biopolymer transporter ExbD [Pirellulaceae bacterium]